MWIGRKICCNISPETTAITVFTRGENSLTPYATIFQKNVAPEQDLSENVYRIFLNINENNAASIQGRLLFLKP